VTGRDFASAGACAKRRQTGIEERSYKSPKPAVSPEDRLGIALGPRVEIMLWMDAI
jgi:hypothetical protein